MTHRTFVLCLTYLPVGCVYRSLFFILPYAEPIFKNHNDYLTTYDCYQQDLPVIVYGDKVTVSVNVSGDNLTLIWTVTINGYTEVIDNNNQHYVLGDQTKVICSYTL